MRVLRLTTGLDFGGIEKVFELFASHYDGPHEYVFLGLGRDGETGERLRSMGFEAHTFGFRNASVYNPKVTIRLYRWLKQHKFDIIHNASAEANFHGTLAARMAGIPVVIAEEIGIANHRKLARIIFKQIYKRVDDFVWIAQAVQQRLIELGEVKRGFGTLIYNPVAIPDEPVEKSELTKGGLHIVSVGRLAAVKNFELLIKLIHQLQLNGKSAKLTLVGEGNYRPVLEGLIKELRVEEAVCLHGYTASPAKVIKNADLYILPSHTEGFGISLVEAMMIGLPVVGSKVGGIPEIIEEGKTGWLMDPNCSPQELMTLVDRIMRLTTESRQAIAKAGTESALKRFHPKTYIQQLESLYQKNLAQKSISV